MTVRIRTDARPRDCDGTRRVVVAKGESEPVMALQLGDITILRFPGDDDEFASRLERVVRLSAASRVERRRFERMLRAHYPSAVVRAHARFTESTGGAVWYVYRDGPPVLAD